MAVDPQELRRTIEALAPIDKRPCSPGEREAAEWIAERLRDLGCEPEIEEERAFDAYAGAMARLMGIGAAAGAAATTGRMRRLAALVAGAAAAGLAEDASNGPRLFRRATMERQPTWNVVAPAGDPEGGHTVVVVAHHDAAPTGRIFDQSFHRWLGRTFPGVVERTDTAIPLWWPAAAAPAVAAWGAVRRSRRASALGTALCLLGVATFADVARSPIVPGANDNLSGVAVLVHLAGALRERPVQGVRVLLVSCGSEEVLQGGIYGFLERHRGDLARESTSFLIVDTVGSPRLIMLEGEGAFVMEDYWDRSLRDRVAAVAEREGIALRRGMRARTSTDAVVPSRARYPTAALASMDEVKAIPHYHLMSDVPDNVDYATVARCADLVEAVIRDMAPPAP